MDGWVGAVSVGGRWMDGWVRCLWVGDGWMGGCGVCGWETDGWVGGRDRIRDAASKLAAIFLRPRRRAQCWGGWVVIIQLSSWQSVPRPLRDFLQSPKRSGLLKIDCEGQAFGLPERTPFENLLVKASPPV
jgi:hypothetical protein